MLYNKLGDFGLVLGLLILFKLLYSLNYGTIFNLSYKYATIELILFNFNLNLIECITFCLFIGSVGKSAQLGFHA
jgi:NADH-quinone oxidoreductase subunit L